MPFPSTPLPDYPEPIKPLPMGFREYNADGTKTDERRRYETDVYQRELKLKAYFEALVAQLISDIP